MHVPKQRDFSKYNNHRSLLFQTFELHNTSLKYCDGWLNPQDKDNAEKKKKDSFDSCSLLILLWVSRAMEHKHLTAEHLRITQQNEYDLQITKRPEETEACNFGYSNSATCKNDNQTRQLKNRKQSVSQERKLNQQFGFCE